MEIGFSQSLSDKDGYDHDQEVTIDELLQAYGLKKAHSVRAPIGDDWNEAQDASPELLPADGGVETVTTFQSLVKPAPDCPLHEDKHRIRCAQGHAANACADGGG
ncbi:Pol Polyprotein [Phytophthora megakarya]|uniref:Pol Polyprotein n=1 Tax=Phytophthora megakarya TaxID=4795 RepID=A0A225VQT0_9STRA|nr:Pol Polyprotein [Phytophthora megakarya]